MPDLSSKPENKNPAVPPATTDKDWLECAVPGGRRSATSKTSNSRMGA